MNNLLQSENFERAGSVAKTRWQELQTSVKQGQFSLRLLALLAGVILVVVAGMGCFTLVISLHWSRALMEFYAFTLGIIVLVLESQQLNLPGIYLQNLFQYALFLKFVWGRGCLYFVAGSLQVAQGGLVDFVAGGYVMGVGLLYMVVGHATARKLQALRNQLYSEDRLRRFFQECDTTQKGTLNIEELRQLTISLGMGLKPQEIEAAFLHMNKADNGELSFEEFKSWWQNYDDVDGSFMYRLV